MFRLLVPDDDAVSVWERKSSAIVMHCWAAYVFPHSSQSMSMIREDDDLAIAGLGDLSRRKFLLLFGHCCGDLNPQAIA